MSALGWDAAAWLVMCSVEVAGLLCYQGPPAAKTVPKIKFAPQLEEFRFFRRVTSDECDSEDETPVFQLSRGEKTPQVARYPQGFSPSRRSTRHAVSVSSESLSQRELAWRTSTAPKSPDTKARLESIFSTHVLMQRLTPESRSTVIEACVAVDVQEGDIVLSEGELGDCCYFVDSGTLSCDMMLKGHRCDYNAGESFGELALMHGNIRAVTITVVSIQAKTDCKLWKLDRGTFKRIVLNASQPRQELFQEFIKRVPVFSEVYTGDMPQDYIDRLVTCSHHLKYNKGDLILAIGHRSAEQYMYLVQEGKVEMILDGEVVETVEPNCFFGERSILLDECPIADAVASEDSEIYRVPETVLATMPKDALSTLTRLSQGRHT